MAANLAPILLFRPCPGSGVLFAAKMVRLASLTPAAPEVPILKVHFPNDSPADLIGQTRVPTSFIVLLKDLRAGVLNQASQYQIYNLTRPDEGIQRTVFVVSGIEYTISCRVDVEEITVDMRTTGSPATTKICTVFPDRVVIHREPAAAAWLTLAPVIAIAVEAYDELVHGV
ncbi:hypothetical protein B0H10DRAFT_2444298 [Mycena sp. CBHHK59/15]|nr:hypothetical protein B0H10DRAFT_2202333 [Mycena sp. CBHHK59/15]KAJ6572683.1 hypothetical protein B0H10DRAFT_2444298 [Mycena sp. CBHHK59/15]